MKALNLLKVVSTPKINQTEPSLKVMAAAMDFQRNGKGVLCEWCWYSGPMESLQR